MNIIGSERAWARVEKKQDDGTIKESLIPIGFRILFESGDHVLWSPARVESRLVNGKRTKVLKRCSYSVYQCCLDHKTDPMNENQFRRKFPQFAGDVIQETDTLSLDHYG